MADSDSTGQDTLWQTGEPGRRCNYCGKWKPLLQFSLKRADRSGRRSQCKDCAAEAQRKRLAEIRQDPERWAHLKRITRSSGLRQTAGINLEEYEAAFAAQGGLCAICGKPETVLWRKKSQQRRSMSADHDHKTGKFRALLCHLCNRGIGLFQDNPDLMEKAAAYIRDHASR